jgi:hypothetical protein
MLLRNGAMVNGYLNEPESLGASLAAAFAAIVAPQQEDGARTDRIVGTGRVAVRRAGTRMT